MPNLRLFPFARSNSPYILSFNYHPWDISILRVVRGAPIKLPVYTGLFSDSIIFKLKFVLSYIIIFDYINPLKYDIVHLNSNGTFSPSFPTKPQGTCGEVVSTWTDMSKFKTCKMLTLEFFVLARGRKVTHLTAFTFESTTQGDHYMWRNIMMGGSILDTPFNYVSL